MKEEKSSAAEIFTTEILDWYKKEYEANIHHEKALAILKNAIQSVIKHPDMTTEIKEVAEALVLSIEDRALFQYDLESILSPLIKIVERGARSKSSSDAAKARYEREAPNKDSRMNAIQRKWASGKYNTRDRCAEEEYSALGFSSFKSARNALKNTPDPLCWPAKN